MLGKVLITARSVAGSSAALQYLRDSGCPFELARPRTTADGPWPSEAIREIDGLIFAMEPVTREFLDNAPRLKVIARPGVGFDTVDMAAATSRRIAVTITAGANHESVADFTLGLLLLLSRRIMEGAQNIRQGEWQPLVGTEVFGKTLLLVGLGRIGQAVARRAQGFGMRVLATARRPDPAVAVHVGVEFVGLEEGLGVADFVSLHVPLTPDTRELIDRRTLAMMKPGVYLINTARGGLVDEEALAEAVRDGRVAGAAVDVISRPGSRGGSPLLAVPGVIVTPHMATYAREAMERVALAAVRSVVAVLRGERPAGVVNPEIYER